MLARGPSTASAQAHAQRSLQRPKAFGCHVRERRTPAAAQVYESLARSGEVSEQELAYFDPEGGEDLLYGLRFLAIAQRPALARYMVAERMDPSGPPSPPSPPSGERPCLWRDDHFVRKQAPTLPAASWTCGRRGPPESLPGEPRGAGTCSGLCRGRCVSGSSQTVPGRERLAVPAARSACAWPCNLVRRGARRLSRCAGGAQEAAVLAKAVKEQERRKGEKEGFSAAPGDCLAYKHYRDVRPRSRARSGAPGIALVAGACWGALCRAALGLPTVQVRRVAVPPAAYGQGSQARRVTPCAPCDGGARHRCPRQTRRPLRRAGRRARRRSRRGATRARATRQCAGA